MSKFCRATDGISLAYEVVGDAGTDRPPVLLIHGFAANRMITWRNTGWFDFLLRAGHRVIALDCRGHGESDKPHAPASYDEGVMAADAIAVLDAEGIATADVLGYSMGGYLTIRLAFDWASRVRRAILGGVGGNYFDYWHDRSEIVAEGLLAKDRETIVHPLAREFRRFAEAAGGDLAALAACMRRPRRIFTRDELHTLPQPFLVACGEADEVSGPAEALAPFFANGRAVSVPKRDHHRTVGDPAFKDAVKNFLTE